MGPQLRQRVERYWKKYFNSMVCPVSLSFKESSGKSFNSKITFIGRIQGCKVILQVSSLQQQNLWSPLVLKPQRRNEMKQINRKEIFNGLISFALCEDNHQNAEVQSINTRRRTMMKQNTKYYLRSCQFITSYWTGKRCRANLN